MVKTWGIRDFILNRIRIEYNFAVQFTNKPVTGSKPYTIKTGFSVMVSETGVSSLWKNKSNGNGKTPKIRHSMTMMEDDKT